MGPISARVLTVACPGVSLAVPVLMNSTSLFLPLWSLQAATPARTFATSRVYWHVLHVDVIAVALATKCQADIESGAAPYHWIDNGIPWFGQGDRIINFLQ